MKMPSRTLVAVSAPHPQSCWCSETRSGMSSEPLGGAEGARGQSRSRPRQGPVQDSALQARGSETGPERTRRGHVPAAPGDPGGRGGHVWGQGTGDSPVPASCSGTSEPSVVATSSLDDPHFPSGSDGGRKQEVRGEGRRGGGGAGAEAPGSEGPGGRGGRGRERTQRGSPAAACPACSVILPTAGRRLRGLCRPARMRSAWPAQGPEWGRVHTDPHREKAR